MHSGNSFTPENPAFSFSIGIAALIIEGRPLYDDEYVSDTADHHQRCRTQQTIPSLAQPCNLSPFPLLGSGLKFGFSSDKTPDRKALACSFTDTPSGSSAFASKTDSTEHLVRLRQKLNLLRTSPSTSRDFAEQSIAVSVESPPASTSSEADLEQNELLGVIYESASKDKSAKAIELQLLASRVTSLQRTPRSLNEHNGLLQTVTSWITNKLTPVKFFTTTSACTSELMSSNASMPSTATQLQNDSFEGSYESKKSDKRNGKLLGPHCTQFLGKIGLLKGTQSDYSFEIDDHPCVKSNEMCFRWQQFYKQIVPIFSRCEPICIEVYLGPEHHVILLEQWIIQQCHDPGRFSMTIQSLCTAIRSQLHFSQITAWSDLLKSSSPNDPDLRSNPRIRASLKMPFKPKLDILYRIRPYSESTSACFSATPIVHTFPEITISDQLSIKVSLKSLPRMKNIPRPSDSSMGMVCADLVSESTTPPLDDGQAFDCQEKGKHRCTFDAESPTDDAVSHRDKQLMKYKKRIMRRDKKKRIDELVSKSIDGGCAANRSDMKHMKNQSMTHFSLLDQPTINPNKPPLYSSMSVDESEPQNGNTDENCCLASTSAASNHSMASIELAQNTMTFTKSTQTTAIEVTSIGTQTDENQNNNVRLNQTCNGQIIFHNCDFCGIEMQYFCWNCDKRMFVEAGDSYESPGKGDLLLKAIQRTPSVKQALNTKAGIIRPSASDCMPCDANNKCSATSTRYASDSSSNVISHSSMGCAVASDKDHCDSLNNKDELDVSDCRSCCKRQKTVHNYNMDERNTKYINSVHGISHSILPSRSHLSDDFSVIPNVTSYDDASAHLLAKREHGDGTGTYRRTMSESVVGTCHPATENCTQPGIDLRQCDTMNILSDNELKLYRRAYSEDELICNCDDNRPKQLDLNANSPPGPSDYSACTATIHTTADHSTQFKTPVGQTIAVNSFDNQTKPIYIDCRNEDERSQDSMTLNTSKSLPKINLSKLFTKTADGSTDVDCAESNDIDISPELEKIAPIPMPIFSFDFEHLSPPLNSPSCSGLVQKSNSAPSFQCSPPTLSPRFLKSAAATKRRSRHLSDRSSERYSIGSDDHLSDEEFHQYCLDPDTKYRPGISPTKATLRFFPKNYAYRKRALLGSFEESLLQRRFEPKFLVPGYKVLLGASGCYCTNQITIPAYTFFYELNDEALSTPYVCEVSMPPRKGYVIPRTGHVQATLLNPNGMVVRMFVVAYDFRDMPAMCQTFVRQRILSFDENANPGRSVDDLSPSEQQKLLRYAIHLRFQTTRSGRLALHGDIRMLISRRTDCDTAAAHAKGAPGPPSELKTVTIVPENPKFSPR